MRRIVYITVAFLMLLLTVSCGNGESETAVPEQPVDTIETDIQTVAAKPQLIEFYASW